MRPPKRQRPARGGATGRKDKTSDPILAHRAVQAELARVQRDPTLTPLRRLAAIVTLQHKLAALEVSP
jgi:hypothetical protein